MSTTGKRYVARTGDHRAERVLDARTRMVIKAVMHAPPGGSLKAYLQATSKGNGKR
jgi:hypothetical protein